MNLIIRIRDDFGGVEHEQVKLGEKIDLPFGARTVEIREGFLQDGQPILIEHEDPQTD